MLASTTPSSPSAAEIAQIEKIERDAWLDMYGAAPKDVAAELGLEHSMIDGGALLISSRLDNLQFNRFLSAGVLSPAREDALDAAIAAFDGAGVRNWVVHVAEGSGPLGRLCEDRGLVPHPRTWAKFVRGPEAAMARTSLTVRAIGRETADAFGAVAAQAYGLPPAVGRWLSALVGRPHWTCSMAFDGEAPVATGATFIDGKSSWLESQPHLLITGGEARSWPCLQLASKLHHAEVAGY